MRDRKTNADPCQMDVLRGSNIDMQFASLVSFFKSGCLDLIQD